MKKIIIIFIIIAAMSVPAYLIFNTYMEEDTFYAQLNEFNSLLNLHDYEQAKQVYEQASNTLKANFNISLDSHAESLSESAKKQETTQEALDLLYEFKEIGYASQTIDDAIIYYEDLLQSNYIFEQGVELYNSKEYKEAMECFDDVLDYDDNYVAAQAYLDDYQSYILAWKEASDSNHYGRSPYPSSLAYQDNYIYLPYKFDDASAILKINAVTYSILSFPVVSNENGAEVSDLNIIGEYIFFLVKQDALLPGKTGNNAVYRISTTGDGLEKMTECDYTYLISYKDKFYAVSKSKGIISADNYFLEETVLVESDEEIINIQLTDEGIFYTTHDGETNINTQYFYNGETSQKIMDGLNLHYYDYGDDNIIYYDSNDLYEYMYHENMSTGSANNNQLYAGDMYKYYGMLNDNVIYTVVGNYQQECIRVRDIVKFNNTYTAPLNEISYVPLGICYEAGFVLLKSDKGISITAEDMRIQQTLALPHINNSVLTENEEKIIIQNDYFTDTPTVITENDEWYYSDENVSIKIEKVYIEAIESTVYISHIHTADDKWLSAEHFTVYESFSENQEGIVWAIAGQAYGSEPEVIDETKGILKTDVYTYNDDGMFFVYRSANIITSDKILAANIIYVFSQGDVILEGYQISGDCLADGGYLSGRSAIGMVEAGHYVAVTAEKSTKTNRGLSLYMLAFLLKEQGCASAFSFDYNDGPFLIFNNEYIYKNNVKTDEITDYNEVLYYSVE